MKNIWNDKEARRFVAEYKAVGEDLALRTYSARLIGKNSSLVLHGGGNTSVKTEMPALTGGEISVLCIKGSGWDLGSIEPAGHPAVKLDALQELRSLSGLSDEAMVNELRANMLDSSGPNPSVEALLHAFLPHKFIDHTHADAVLALLDQPHAEKRVKQWAGSRMAFVPYIMPGFALAKLAAEIYERSPNVEGLLLYKHGIFTFGSTAKESYDRMIYWVSKAEKTIAGIAKKKTKTSFPTKPDPLQITTIANTLRKYCVLERKPSLTSDSKRRMIVRFRSNPAILQFLGRKDLTHISQVGPATPDHVIRTKPVPLIFKNGAESIGSAVSSFTSNYEKYFRKESGRKKVQRKMLDPLPRIVLAPGVGLFSVAADAKAGDIALDVYEHTIEIISNASAYGRYEALPSDDLFDMEYWSLEQAKLGKEKILPFDGQVVWISGAASGIGLATSKAFAGMGAHVFGVDLKKSQTTQGVCDVTDPDQVKKSFQECSRTFGGVDIVISNAGIAPTGAMDQVSDAVMRRSFEINFFAHQTVAQAAVEILKRQGLGGSLLFNASKSTFNPGPDFGPYTLPKTAVIGLMKQYAVELGRYGIRCNAVNADRVNTGLYEDGLLSKRAKARGVSVSEYLSGNLLKQEVFADDVALAFVHLAQMQKTTGATLPVDGGNAAAFPR